MQETINIDDTLIEQARCVEAIIAKEAQGSSVRDVHH